MGGKSSKNKNQQNEIPKQKPKQKNAADLENEIEYKYNSEGELVHKMTGEKVGKLTQGEYEQVGIYVEKYIEEQLINNLHLKVLYVPNNSSDLTQRNEKIAQTRMLVTQDFYTNPKCLLLLPGAGVVKLGQWARSVCINENLDLGSMIPYVQEATRSGFSVAIFNSNELSDFEYGEKIKEFDCMENHSLYVYNNVIKKNNAIKELYFVAHSMGGVCTLEILLKNKEDLMSGKIKKIAFTDSVHAQEYLELGEDGVKKFREITRNYICSDEPAGTFIGDYTKSYRGVDSYSSGHKKHEYTSGSAIYAIFDFLKE